MNWREEIACHFFSLNNKIKNTKNETKNSFISEPLKKANVGKCHKNYLFHKIP